MGLLRVIEIIGLMLRVIKLLALCDDNVLTLRLDFVVIMSEEYFRLLGLLGLLQGYRRVIGVIEFIGVMGRVIEL